MLAAALGAIKRQGNQAELSTDSLEAGSDIILSPKIPGRGHRRLTKTPPMVAEPGYNQDADTAIVPLAELGFDSKPGSSTADSPFGPDGVSDTRKRDEEASSVASPPPKLDPIPEKAKSMQSGMHAWLHHVRLAPLCRLGVALLEADMA